MYHIAFVILIVCQLLLQSIACRVEIDQETLVSDSLTNIHVKDLGPGTYKAQASPSCQDQASSRDIEIGNFTLSDAQSTTKLIWHIPASLDGQRTCIKFYNDQNTVVATSSMYQIKAAPTKKKGDWDHLLFDTMKFHSNLQRASIVAESKNKRIGIIGAGASGLFSAYLLDSVGFHNYEILEASQRLGGRIRTVYFGKPEEYRYQEMGPMRIPYSNTYKNKTLRIKDHQIVFQVAEELNKLNEPKDHIKFIDWIEHNDNLLYYENDIRLPNGQSPTQGDVKRNASLKLDLGDTGRQAATAFDEYSLDKWKDILMENIYTAHQSVLDQGADDWSEWSYVHNKLGESLNISALAAEGSESATIWGKLYEAFVMSTDNWKTIDQGLNRFANAFQPFIGNKVRYETKVSKLAFTKDKKVDVHWKTSPFDPFYQTKTYDRVIVTAPFSVVRTWHLPQLSYTIDKAIHTLGYSQACKIALEFNSRFWEQGDRPIFGGCSITDTTSDRVCYPPYGHADAADGRGVILGSYISGDMAIRLASMTDEEHAARVLENVVELHGEHVRQQFTGNYHRYCGIHDPNAASSWARPLAGQHTLFIPSYFEIEQGLVFVGEHTDVKHAWISAALASALRGVVMILIEAGHVDDARKLVQYWNAPWMAM